MAFPPPVSRWTKRRRTQTAVTQLLNEMQNNDGYDEYDQFNYIDEVTFPSNQVSQIVSATDISFPCDNARLDETHNSDELNEHTVINDSLSISDQVYAEAELIVDSDCPPPETSESDDDDEDCLLDEIAEWAAQYSITLSALGALLKFMRKRFSLP